MAEFAKAISEALNLKAVNPQDDVVISDAKTNRVPLIVIDNQHIANPITIAMAILNTFLSLRSRCCPTLTCDFSPGILCDLSLR